MIVAIFALMIGILLAKPFLAENYGLFISHFALTTPMLGILGIVIISTIVLGLIPSLSAYRMSLNQDLIVKR